MTLSQTALALAVALAASGSAGSGSDWRGCPRGAFVDPTGFLAKGVGDAPRTAASVLASARAPGLESLGEDVIRFSSSPIKARTAFIIEIERRGAGPVEGSVATFKLGRTRWEQTSVRRFSMKFSDLTRLEATVDNLVTQPVGRFGGDEIIVCADDPGFLTERLRDGSKVWRSGSYVGDPTNYEILEAIVAAAGLSGIEADPACGKTD